MITILTSLVLCCSSTCDGGDDLLYTNIIANAILECVLSNTYK